MPSLRTFYPSMPQMHTIRSSSPALRITWQRASQRPQRRWAGFASRLRLTKSLRFGRCMEHCRIDARECSARDNAPCRQFVSLLLSGTSSTLPNDESLSPSASAKWLMMRRKNKRKKKCCTHVQAECAHVVRGKQKQHTKHGVVKRVYKRHISQLASLAFGLSSYHRVSPWTLHVLARLLHRGIDPMYERNAGPSTRATFTFVLQIAVAPRLEVRKLLSPATPRGKKSPGRRASTRTCSVVPSLLRWTTSTSPSRMTKRESHSSPSI